MPTAKLLEVLSHPMTLGALDSLSKGSDPRGVLAGIAGDLLAARVAEALGVSAPARAIRASSKAQDDDGIIDAEYRVINVTPGVKRRTAKR